MQLRYVCMCDAYLRVYVYAREETMKRTHGQDQFYGAFNKELFWLAQNPKPTRSRFHNYFISIRRGLQFHH